MTAAGWIVGLAMAGLVGRLVLWTSLRRLGPRASTLEAVRGPRGAIEYRVAPHDLACRGHVVVRHDGSCAPWAGLRLRGLEPAEVRDLLRAAGFEADLVPEGGSSGPALAPRWDRLLVLARKAMCERKDPRRLSLAGEQPRL